MVYYGSMFQLIVEIVSKFDKPYSQITLAEFTDYIKANISEGLVVIPKSSLEILICRLKELEKENKCIKEKYIPKRKTIPEVSVSVLKLRHIRTDGAKL